MARTARSPAGTATPAWSSPETDVERPFEVGAAVTHSEWGSGEVQRYDGDRVVLFESVGYRTLDLELVTEKDLLKPEPQGENTAHPILDTAEWVENRIRGAGGPGSWQLASMGSSPGSSCWRLVMADGPFSIESPAVAFFR